MAVSPVNFDDVIPYFDGYLSYYYYYILYSPLSDSEIHELDLRSDLNVLYYYYYYGVVVVWYF